MNKINKYREWIKINESENADGVYITINFNEPTKDETSTIQINLINEIFSKFSGCKIEKISTDTRAYFNQFIIEISTVDSSDFEFFGEMGIFENIKLISPFINASMSFIRNQMQFPSSFKIINKRLRNNSITFAIDKNNFNKTDDEIIDLIINSINIKKILPQFAKFALSKYDSKSSPNELTEANLQEAIFESDTTKRSALISKLNLDLEYTVYSNYYKSQTAKSLLSISRETIRLDEYQKNVDTRINSIQEKSKNLSNFTEDERFNFIKEIILLQKYLGKSCYPGYIESKIASQKLLKTYEILDSSKISETEVDLVSQKLKDLLSRK